MAGEVVKKREAKHRDKHQQSKAKKNGAASEKHKFPLAEQMDDAAELPARNRSVKMQKMQESEEYVNPKTSNKILGEARRQQQEIQQERDEETGVAAARRAFSTVAPSKKISMDCDRDDEDEGFSDNDERQEEIEDISEEKERIMSMFTATDEGQPRLMTKQRVSAPPRGGLSLEARVYELEHREAACEDRVGKLEDQQTKLFTDIARLQNMEDDVSRMYQLENDVARLAKFEEGVVLRQLALDIEITLKKQLISQASPLEAAKKRIFFYGKDQKLDVHLLRQMHLHRVLEDNPLLKIWAMENTFLDERSNDDFFEVMHELKEFSSSRVHLTTYKDRDITAAVLDVINRSPSLSASVKNSAKSLARCVYISDLITTAMIRAKESSFP